MTRLFSLLFVISLFVSVNAQTVLYTMETESRVYNSEKYNRDSVYIIDISWPVFDETRGFPELGQILNKFVRKQLPGETTSVKSGVDDMIKFYMDFESEDNFGVYWNYDARISVKETGGEIISIIKNEYDYSGGAHGNGFVGYYNFDINSGSILTLSDLLVPGTYEKVTAAGDKIFRQQTEIGDGDLNEAGYWFEGGKFYLNENFLITETGLSFFYNSYEIAPYAGGPTELEIPYSAIQDCIKKDGPLKFLF